MNILPWTPDYSIGVFRLDEEHQEMVVLVNKLFESLLQGTNTRKIDAYIEELRDKTNTHFRTEEIVMRETSYPDIEAHLAEHAAFLADLAKYDARAHEAAGTLEMYDLTRELSQYLKDWLHTHICITDKKLGVHLNSKGIH